MDSVGKCIKLPGLSGYNVRIESLRSEVRVDVAGRCVDLLANVSIKSVGGESVNGNRNLAIEICVSNAKGEAYRLDMKQAELPAIEIDVDWTFVQTRIDKTPSQANVVSALRFLLLSMARNKRWLYRKDMITCRYCGRFELPDHKTDGVRCGLMPCPTCDGYMRKDSPHDSCARCRRRR